MKQKRWRSFLWACGICFLCALGFILGSSLLQAWREYQHFRQREIAYQQQLQGRQDEMLLKKAYLNRILDSKDPQFIERIARQKLGYVRPDEVIFRFEPDTEKTVRFNFP